MACNIMRCPFRRPVVFTFAAVALLLLIYLISVKTRISNRTYSNNDHLQHTNSNTMTPSFKRWVSLHTIVIQKKILQEEYEYNMLAVVDGSFAPCAINWQTRWNITLLILPHWLHYVKHDVVHKTRNTILIAL